MWAQRVCSRVENSVYKSIHHQQHEQHCMALIMFPVTVNKWYYVIPQWDQPEAVRKGLAGTTKVRMSGVDLVLRTHAGWCSLGPASGSLPILTTDHQPYNPHPCVCSWWQPQVIGVWSVTENCVHLTCSLVTAMLWKRMLGKMLTFLWKSWHVPFLSYR